MMSGSKVELQKLPSNVAIRDISWGQNPKCPGKTNINIEASTLREVNELPNNCINAEEQLVLALNQYEKLIFSICYRMTNNYFDAQDLTQETFLTYFKVLPQFDGQNEKGFLSKIATNKCLDYLRRSQYRAVPSEQEILENNASTVPPPEEELMDKMIQQQLLTLCQSLKPPYDEVAEAYYCQGQTASQIAQSKGKKLKTIQTQIGRAKKMLQKLYRKEELLMPKGGKSI